ncbi:MAG: ACT domain-containing protein, partial [Methanobacteriota archaeon]
MATVARQVRDYIAGHPSISDALKMDIVNYSALARKISRELGIRKEEAVLAACRRYPVEKLRGYSEDAVRRTLQKSRIQTRTKVATITVVEGVDVLQRLGDVVEELLDENKECRLIQVSQGTVIIADDDSVSRVTRKLRPEQIISVTKGLVEISVTSPETIE